MMSYKALIAAAALAMVAPLVGAQASSPPQPARAAPPAAEESSHDKAGETKLEPKRERRAHRRTVRHRMVRRH